MLAGRRDVSDTAAVAMGAFGVFLGILHYTGLYIQLNAAQLTGGEELDNVISGNGKLCLRSVCCCCCCCCRRLE